MTQPTRPQPSHATQAIQHLETAEAAILSWSSALDRSEDDDAAPIPSVSHMLYSVLANIGRALGILELERALDTLELERGFQRRKSIPD